MCTFLGTAGKINKDDLDINSLKKVKLFFLKDICGMKVIQNKLLIKQLFMEKMAMSLSDQFCVDRHKAHFLELVKNRLDIIFAKKEK